jgi:hypothetical protein
LSAHLVFPFAAGVPTEGWSGEDCAQPKRVSVIGLGDPDEPINDETYGILCEARLEGRVMTVPLGELNDVGGKPNRQLIKDYSYWLYNWC